MSDMIHVGHCLDDFIDDQLGAGELEAVLAHLEGCAECRAEAEALLAIQGGVRALPREIAPPRDLWAGIAARLEPRGVTDSPAPRPVIDVDFRRASPPAWRRWAGMAAAAMILVALSSGITAYLLRPPAAQTVAAIGARPPLAAGAINTALVAFRPAEAEYIATVEALEADLDARRDQLAPETIAVVEANLRIIDQAIHEARAALASDAGNADLPLHLSDVYRQKVQLLQRAVQLPTVAT